jgi:hypothetical protein
MDKGLERNWIEIHGTVEPKLLEGQNPKTTGEHHLMKRKREIDR